jgi:hypothetical protein
LRKVTRITRDWIAILTTTDGIVELTTARRFPYDPDGANAKAWCSVFREQYQNAGFAITFSNTTTVILESGNRKVTLIAKRADS